MFKKIIPNLLILIMAFALTSCISDVDENNNRNYDLYSKIMCPVCDGQTIGESQASIANDMKKIIDIKYLTEKQMMKYLSISKIDMALKFSRLHLIVALIQLFGLLH